MSPSVSSHAHPPESPQDAARQTAGLLSAELPGLTLETAQVLELARGGLARVIRIFDDELRSDLPEVAALVSLVERYRGKMLRPILTLVVGLASQPDEESRATLDALSDEHYVSAAVIEMVHMATLVHDDVLDEADVRRRGPTINRLHGNEPAVILGDLLIASAYHLCSRLANPEAARMVARASVVTATGELLQLHHRGDFALSEATYARIIAGKTAELIATAAELGAWAASATAEVRAASRAYGLAIGSAFQIQDDILDLLGDQASVGKSVGKDFEKGKMTLPAICRLAGFGPPGVVGPEGGAQRSVFLDLLERATHAGDTSAASELAKDLVKSGAVDAARRRAGEWIAQAKASLSAFEPSAARSALEVMADAVLSRQS